MNGATEISQSQDVKASTNTNENTQTVADHRDAEIGRTSSTLHEVDENQGNLSADERLLRVEKQTGNFGAILLNGCKDLFFFF